MKMIHRNVRWRWLHCGLFGGPRGRGQQREWELGGKGINLDLQRRHIAELLEPCQELSFLEGCHSHIPGGQVRGMCRAAEEMGHFVVGGVVIRAECRRDHWPSLWSSSKTGAMNSCRIWAGKWRFGNTRAAVFWLGLLERVTMKLEHTKSAESLIRGCSVAQQVHLLSQLRVLELMETRSLPTPGLCQPWSLPEP